MDNETSRKPPWWRGPLGVHDLATLGVWARAHGVAPAKVRGFRRRLYREANLIPVALQELEGAGAGAPAAARSDLQLLESRDSQVDGSTKLVFATPDGLRLESIILRIRTGRTSLCVSSQVGCAAACRFCATGSMGLAKNLSSAQILDQLVVANHLLAPESRRVRNVVFMGMGEPFHNAVAVRAALDVMVCPRRFGLSPRRVTVSSVGIVPRMLELATERPQIRQALSLHSARDEIREALVPMNAKYGVADLRAAVTKINALTGDPVFLEITLFDGVNDTDADLEALLDFVQGTQVHVNLIPYNDIGTAELRAAPQAHVERFSGKLREAGWPVTVRRSLGADIQAACGQLVRAENAAVARRSHRSTNEPGRPNG